MTQRNIPSPIIDRLPPGMGAMAAMAIASTHTTTITTTGTTIPMVRTGVSS